MVWSGRVTAVVGVLALGGAAASSPRSPAPAAAEAAAQERLNMRPNFSAEPATTYDQTLRIVQKRMMQGEQALEAILRRLLVVRTVEATADGATIELSMARVALQITPPVRKIFVFDSDRAPIENPRTPLADSLQALSRLTLTFRLTPEGQATLVDGRERLAEALAKDPKGEMAAYFSEEALSELMGDLFGIAAQSTGEIGGEWSSEETTELGGVPNVRVGIRYKLASVTDGVARIEGRGLFELPEQPPVIDGLKTTIKDQINQFEIFWNTRVGRVESFRSEQTLTLDQGGDVMKLGIQLATLGELKRVEPGAPGTNVPPVSLPPHTTTEPAPEGIPRKPGS